MRMLLEAAIAEAAEPSSSLLSGLLLSPPSHSLSSLSLFSLSLSLLSFLSGQPLPSFSMMSKIFARLQPIIRIELFGVLFWAHLSTLSLPTISIHSPSSPLFFSLTTLTISQLPFPPHPLSPSSSPPAAAASDWLWCLQMSGLLSVSSLTLHTAHCTLNNALLNMHTTKCAIH